MNEIAASFEEFNHCWERLSSKSTSHYDFGPNRLSLHFAGQSLRPILTEAFAHLAADDDKVPSMRIRIWDSNEKQMPLPCLDWRRYHANGYRGYTEGSYYFHYFDSIGALSFINLEDNIAYYVVRDANELPWWVSGSPLQVILGVWFRSHGSQLTHVGAVGNESNCVLLAGKGGSGKTTTTLSCVQDGLNYLGEDYCLLSPGESTLVHSVYQSAKWTPQTRRFYPEYEQFVVNKSAHPSEKSLLFYQDLFPERIRDTLQANAIVSLTVGSELKPSINRANMALSLKNLSLSTVHQLPFFESKTFLLLSKFAESLVHYEMELGQDRRANVNAIKSLLAGS